MLQNFYFYRCKEIWPIQIAFNHLGTNMFYNKTVIDVDLKVFIPIAEWLGQEMFW